MPTKEKVDSRKQIRLVENGLKGAQNMFSYPLNSESSDPRSVCF
jgi:hypothetical protein